MSLVRCLSIYFRNFLCPHLFSGKDGSLGWRAIAVGASPLPNASSSPKPRNAHAAVSLPANCGGEAAVTAAAASVAIASEKEERRPMMVVIGGSTMDEGPTMDVLVLENANGARLVLHFYQNVRGKKKYGLGGELTMRNELPSIRGMFLRG